MFRLCKVRTAETAETTARTCRNILKGGKIFCFCVGVSILFASCKVGLYTKPNATSYTRKHQTLAIVTPNVIVNSSKVKINTEEDRKTQEKSISQNVQNGIQQAFLKNIRKGKIYLEIQDIEKTNRKLLEIGYFDKDSTILMSPEKLAEALGVDAVLLTNCKVTFVRSIAGGVAEIVFGVILLPTGLFTLTGIMLMTQGVQWIVGFESIGTDIKLYDGKTGDFLWQYSRLLNHKQMCRKIPYHKKNR